MPYIRRSNAVDPSWSPANTITLCYSLHLALCFSHISESNKPQIKQVASNSLLSGANDKPQKYKITKITINSPATPRDRNKHFD